MITRVRENCSVCTGTKVVSSSAQLSDLINCMERRGVIRRARIELPRKLYRYDSQ